LEKKPKEKIKLIFPKTRRQKRLEKQDEWKEKMAGIRETNLV